MTNLPITFLISIVLLVTLPIASCGQPLATVFHGQTMDRIEQRNHFPWSRNCPITRYARAYADLDSKTIKAAFGTPDDMGFTGRRWGRLNDIPEGSDGPPLRVLIDRATLKIRLIDDGTGRKRLTAPTHCY